MPGTVPRADLRSISPWRLYQTPPVQPLLLCSRLRLFSREATTEFTVWIIPLTRRGGMQQVSGTQSGANDCQVTDKADGNPVPSKPHQLLSGLLSEPQAPMLQVLCKDDTPGPKSLPRQFCVEGCDPCAGWVLPAPGFNKASLTVPNNFVTSSPGSPPKVPVKDAGTSGQSVWSRGCRSGPSHNLSADQEGGGFLWPGQLQLPKGASPWSPSSLPAHHDASKVRASRPWTRMENPSNSSIHEHRVTVMHQFYASQTVTLHTIAYKVRRRRHPARLYRVSGVIEVGGRGFGERDGTFDIFYYLPACAQNHAPSTWRFWRRKHPTQSFQSCGHSDEVPMIQEQTSRQQQAAPPGAGFQPWVTSDSYEPIRSSVNGSGFRPFDMVIPFSFRKGEITGEVLMPSGKSAQPLITDNLDGTVTVQYSPTEAGLHEMHIKYNGTHIPESPLQFYVNHASSPNVTAYGPGLSYGVANKLATFTVYTEDASEGGLDLAIEGPSKAEISCVDNKDGTCSVSYLPTLPGDYNILVKYNDEHIAGSPFTARITEDNQRRSQVKLGSAADFSLDINETDLSLLTASIRAPSGRDEPCLLKRMANNHIGISFIPG
ncbi:filamin-B, partial [Lates japonicus]